MFTFYVNLIICIGVINLIMEEYKAVKSNVVSNSANQKN